MTSIQSVQNRSSLEQMQGVQQASKAAASMPNPALSPSADADRLSISNAARQALEGQDPSQLAQASQTYPTYGMMPAQQHPMGANPAGAALAAPVAPVDPVASAALQARA